MPRGDGGGRTGRATEQTATPPRIQERSTPPSTTIFDRPAPPFATAVNTWIGRQPIPSTKKLEQEIANEDRQLKRLTDRLSKLDDTHLDAARAKADKMGRQLAAKRAELKVLQRAGRRPNVKSVKEKDVVVPLKRKCHREGGDPPVTPPTDSQPPKA